MDIIATIAKELSLKVSQVKSAVALIDEGNTIPFIARYRKEVTGSIDDQVLRVLFERLTYLRSLEQQREKVRTSIEEQGKLTEELLMALTNAVTLTEIEDIYRPYRPKRKTRASIAKAKGLQPLADCIYAQNKDLKNPIIMAEDYVNEELGVSSPDEALQGAKDIIAEIISDDAQGRKRIRNVCKMNGEIAVKAAKDELDVYEMYGDFAEAINKMPGHRILAINRGEKEGYLKVAMKVDPVKAYNILSSLHIKGDSAAQEILNEVIEDSYSRLIFPGIEREIRNELTDIANESAIKLFATNTRQLLMQPPVKAKVTLGLDPGYRTGCKVAVVDGTGKLLDTGVIYPVPPHKQMEKAKEIVKNFVKKYNVEIFAIGNGTASHETEVFAADVIKEMDRDLCYMVVSEAGASVYSASKLAAEEFPDHDVSLRSAVSIARRLQDPLAELVKIDPKAIGVGQYQHDMPEKQLSEALDGVVEDCVNTVGADLNTASAPLLNRIAGVGNNVAKNIVDYRQENGIFTSLSQLKKVPKLGAKTFEQCAGFLRVAESKNVLDNTSVHPESYKAAKQLMDLCGFTNADVKNGNIEGLSQKVESMGLENLAAQVGIGVPTLSDIIGELQKPGRDPREELPQPMLRTDVMGMEDLKTGMELKGTVRNVIDFGAFVDVGVHQDGLVHVSQIANKFIKHPSEILKVGDIVDVWVLSVEVEKKRIALTMKKPC
ncbi:MAG: Tex family protein [Clostridiales bacterium]